jgi:hypothetical protein
VSEEDELGVQIVHDDAQWGTFGAQADNGEAVDVPSDAANGQSKVWYSSAILAAMITKTKMPEARSEIALPDFPRYRALFRDTAGFARTNRRLQCLQPAKEFVPPTKPPTGRRKPPEPYPGTRFGDGTILRASAAINDALRQLWHLGAYETPDSLPDLEQIGIWLHHAVPALPAFRS